MRGAEAIAEALSRQGVREVFTYMSRDIVKLVADLSARDITVFQAHHEHGAIGMADGYSRTTGRTGVALVGAGVGLTNGLNALISLPLRLGVHMPAPGSIIVRKQEHDVTMWIIAASVAVALTANVVARAQSTGATQSSPSPNPIVLVDSTGKVVARPLNETVMLVTISSGLVAPALIRPIYDADGRTASALATWQAGGSVLFSSSDCTSGAHVYSSPHAGVRATTQVQTSAGIMLYVGAVGTATTVAIHSILYDTGCAPVTVRQNGLLPVLATVNLNTEYPPPLSFQ